MVATYRTLLALWLWAMLPCAGLAQTVTLDFDAPAFALESSHSRARRL